MDRRTPAIALTICLIIVLAMYFGNKNKQAANTASPKVFIPESVITELKETKFLYKIDPQLNEAYINYFMWSSIPVDQKEIVSKTLAYYCGQKNSGNIRVRLYDHMTGKQLAKYSESLGFSVED